MPWLLVAGDDFFEVFAEVLIERDGRVALPGFTQNFGDGPPAAMGRADYGNRPVIFLFDNHFAALLDFIQHRAHIASEFGLGDPHRSHTFDHNCSSPFSSSLAKAETGPTGAATG